MACANIGEANADIAGIGVSIFNISRGADRSLTFITSKLKLARSFQRSLSSLQSAWSYHTYSM